MTNDCYIPVDIIQVLAMMLLIVGVVIIIPVSMFMAFVPIKRIDVGTEKVQYIPHLIGIGFFCMVTMVGLIIDTLLFKNCLSVISSTVIVLVGVAVGIFSGFRYKRLLLDKARVNEFQAKLKEIKKTNGLLSSQDASSEQQFTSKQSTAKGLQVYFSMIFVQIAIIASGCYLLLIGLPWFDQWISIVLALLIFGANYAGHYYLKRKRMAFIDKFLDEGDSPGNSV